MGKFFKGYYFKHQKGNETLCLIVGHSSNEEFIQVITNDISYNVPLIGNNKFSKKGVILDIKTRDLSLSGKISYSNLTPIKYDIMGPFKYLPLECSHGIVSMHHSLKGSVILNGRAIDFTDGVGYIEMDMGTSFPKAYIWVQCNDFKEKCSIVASVAHIPFFPISFKGCICVINYHGKEYRLATYLGVRVLCCTENKLILKQGRYRLEIRIKPSVGNKLNAPSNGEMIRTIIENPSCPANFRFFINNKLAFNLTSKHASFELEQ